MSLACGLTFDFDAASVWLGSYKSRNPSMISRGEFGAVAMFRVLDLLRKYEIAASFCVPGHTALSYPDLVRRIADGGHEIVHHGWVHENPADFSEQDERRNIERGLEAIFAAAQVVPKGYRSPSWDFSERTIGILKDFGFVYDSSLMGSDFTPYYARQGDVFDDVNPFIFGENIDLVELPVSWLMDDFPHFEFVENDTYGLSAPSKVEEIWKGEFDYAHQHVSDGIFSITMHPQVIGRGHRMLMLERLIQYFSADGKAHFTTLIDYAETWRIAHPLDVWVRSNAVQAQHASGRATLPHQST